MLGYLVRLALVPACPSGQARDRLLAAFRDFRR